MAMASLLVFCLSATLFLPGHLSESVKTGYVVKDDNGAFSFHTEPQKLYVAKADFVNAINSTGWAYLTVTTSDQYTNEEQAYGAGFIEGQMTKDLIQMFWHNTIEGQFCERPMSPTCWKLREFLEKNLNWMKEKIDDDKRRDDDDDDYWNMVAMFLYQVDGLSDGFFNHKGEATLDIDPMGLYLLTLSDDLEDLLAAMQQDPASHAVDQRRRPVGSGSCSSLVKLLPGNKELYLAHDTWSSYQNMLRVLKKYDFSFHTAREAGSTVPPIFSLLSLDGDMEDLLPAMTPGYQRKAPVGSGSCSALVKMLPGNKDLLFSHDTWSTFQSMLRILKKYDFSFHTTQSKTVVPGKAMTMSSYPGVILSGDDFYLINSKLASMETTIGNSNPSLNKYITYDTILEGIRTMVANRLATSGMEWVKLFAKYNSGTYNNQWMVADYGKFMPGFAPSDGLLTVLEQIPGNIKYADVTDVLRKQSYWPSYNIPYFPEIFNKSGCWDNVHKYGDWFTYDKAPRALIFARDHGKVVDQTSMMKLMRYNDFQHDPLSRCNCTPPYSGENGISARSDLNPASGTYPFGALGHRSHGGTDMKMTSSAMMIEQEFMAISGPTYDQEPPFQWSTADFAAACPHVGQPDVFKFFPIFFNGTFQVDKEMNVKHRVFAEKGVTVQ